VGHWQDLNIGIDTFFFSVSISKKLTAVAQKYIAFVQFIYPAAIPIWLDVIKISTL